MKQNLIPLVWDDGRIGSVVADPNGDLRLHHAIDDDMEAEGELAMYALRLQRAVPPYHASPSVDATDVNVLMQEPVWPRS